MQETLGQEYLLEKAMATHYSILAWRISWTEKLIFSSTTIEKHRFFSAQPSLWSGSRKTLSSVTRSCPTLCNPMDRSTPGLPAHHQLLELAQTHVHLVNDAINHLILCHSLLLLPSIFPSIRVFSSESVLLIRWPKYWSFNFSIRPANEYSGLISFRID